MAALLIGAVLAPPALGQATTGEITGRISDAGGLSVPGVTVTASNAQTGFSRSAVSNADGAYTITLLPPGRYGVSAELAGFRRAVREDVDVAVGSRPTVLLELQVGQLTEAVLVSGAAPLVQTTRSDISGVVTATDIANLPTLNRTFANIAVMMPEARPAGGFDPTKTRVATSR